MTAFTKQPCFISTYIHDDAVCREEEDESVGYLTGTAVLVKSELKVHQVWLWKVGKWDVEDRKNHQWVFKAVTITGLSTRQDSWGLGTSFWDPRELDPRVLSWSCWNQKKKFRRWALALFFPWYGNIRESYQNLLLELFSKTLLEILNDYYQTQLLTAWQLCLKAKCHRFTDPRFWTGSTMSYWLC